MVVPPQRDGGQRQYVESPLPETSCESIQPVLNHITENLDEPHTVPDLARLAMMSERTFARRFVAETGTTPHRWIVQQRVLRARELLEQTDLPVDSVATHSGFGSAALLRTHFQSVVGTSPQRYRREFSAR
jgi:transcriptional regulator GlxA family with amidase domain